MQTLAALLYVIATVQAAPTQGQFSWNIFKTELGTETELMTFAQYHRKIIEHNEKFRLGLVSYGLKVNEYAHMPHQDFVQNINGYNHKAKALRKNQKNTDVPTTNMEIPKAIDWREIGAVTEVKKQGQYCGACWAFSATGALEGQYFRQTGELVSLSAQNLIDCSGAHGTSGCDGGLMDDAFKYVRDNGGIDTEHSYPYRGEQSQCRYKPRHSAITLVDIVDLPSGDEAQLVTAVALVGPVSVAVDASQMTFQSYSHGVYYEPHCSSLKVNHAMLVVGYGTDALGGDYWLLKNSWGKSWGIDGYMKLARNRDNHCGIATVASYPII